MKILKSLWFWLVVVGVVLAVSIFATLYKPQAEAPLPQTTKVVPSKAGQLSDQKAQYFPLQSYRVGPYAAGGSGFFGGFIDYLKLVNAQGGVNGVKLVWSECETEYVVEKAWNAMSA